MTYSPRLTSGHVINPRLESRPASTHLQWQVVDIPRDIARHEAAQLLSEQAEHGRWELARSVIFVGGARRVWLRRRTMRVERTDASSST
jgi:hypothetical protein